MKKTALLVRDFLGMTIMVTFLGMTIMVTFLGLVFCLLITQGFQSGDELDTTWDAFVKCLAMSSLLGVSCGIGFCIKGQA